jgi:hypothetical protein
VPDSQYPPGGFAFALTQRKRSVPRPAVTTGEGL